MDFKKHLEIAWNTTLEHIVMLIFMTLVMLVVSFFTLGILAPVVMAGFTQAVIELMRNGTEPRIDDLFSQMKLFLPLLGFSFIVFLATLVGLFLFVLPGFGVVLVVTFGCLYMIPLMTDQKMGLIEAIKSSWAAAIGDSVADHIVVVILYIGLIATGSSIFIGTLLTLPFATVFLISVYFEKISSTPTADAPALHPNNNDTL
jgi:uncharacterized membrane protein